MSNRLQEQGRQFIAPVGIGLPVGGRVVEGNGDSGERPEGPEHLMRMPTKGAPSAITAD